MDKLEDVRANEMEALAQEATREPESVWVHRPERRNCGRFGVSSIGKVDKLCKGVQRPLAGESKRSCADFPTRNHYRSCTFFRGLPFRGTIFRVFNLFWFVEPRFIVTAHSCGLVSKSKRLKSLSIRAYQ